MSQKCYLSMKEVLIVQTLLNLCISHLANCDHSSLNSDLVYTNPFYNMYTNKLVQYTSKEHVTSNSMRIKYICYKHLYIRLYTKH